MSVHVIPQNDERPHCIFYECWCNPRVEWLDPETNLPWANGSCRVIHNAADCREISEQVTGECVDDLSKWEVVEAL